MHLKLSIVTLFTLSSLTMLAQLGLPQGREGSVRPFNEYVLSDWVLKNQSKHRDVEGTPYFSKDWLKGGILTIHNQKFTDVTLKFNLYEGHLMHRNTFTGDSSLINEALLWGFSLKLDDSVYVFEKIETPKEKKAGKMSNFYIVLLSGENNLLVKPKVMLQKSSDNSLVNSTGKLKDRFVTRNEYYVQRPDHTLIRLKNSKRSLQQIFGKHMAACKTFAAQNKIEWGEPNHLKSLISYYNQISAQ